MIDLDMAIPSLIRYGFTKLTPKNPDHIELSANLLTDAKIKIYWTSKEIDSYPLISDLLTTHFSYEKNPAFRFFYVYQIIELLIDHVYKNENELLINELIAARGDQGKTKDTIDKIQKYNAEKKRLQLLVDEYTGIRSKLDPLKGLCNKLLKLLGREESQEFNVYFYSIRNFIFHKFF